MFQFKIAFNITNCLPVCFFVSLDLYIAFLTCFNYPSLALSIPSLIFEVDVLSNLSELITGSSSHAIMK